LENFGFNPDIHHESPDSYVGFLLGNRIFILPLTLPDRTGHHFVFGAHSFGVADAGCDIVQHDIGEMKHIAGYAGFFFNSNVQSANDLYYDQSYED